MNTTTRTTRPLSIAHLIFGLIFAGIAALWFIGNASDADLPNQAAGLPVVLIGAGIVGLIAAVISRRRTTAAAVDTSAYDTSTYETSTSPEDTTVLDDPKDEA